MGRNNLENDFRDQLNEREIKPSAQAWDRLDAMLTVAEEKNPKRSFNWLYIAASFAGFLLVASIFFNQKPEIIQANPAVSNPTAVAPEKVEETINAIPAPEASEIASASEVKTKQQSKSIKAIQRITENPKQESILADNSIDQNKSIINQKQEVADSTNPSENAKADELLALVQAKSKNDSPKSVKVNARALLSNVEGAGSKGTFKDKVFRTVGKNYQNVKVALSNRNIEDENH